MTILDIEKELKKVTQMPAWGRKQTDDWDRDSSFIYRCRTHEELLKELQKNKGSDDFKNYVIHRWYNAMSAFGVEMIFTSHPNVHAQMNRFDKLIDFSIEGVTFDHKTTVFPKGFGKNIEYAKQNPIELIHWLYQMQSTQGRFHLENRLFVVLYSSDGNHWKLRSELSALKSIIDSYVKNFDVTKLHQCFFQKEKITLSDIIWFQK